MNTVSCIIAAYNEEKRIGDVLKVVSTHPLIDKVVVVDDAHWADDASRKLIKV